MGGSFPPAVGGRCWGMRAALTRWGFWACGLRPAPSRAVGSPTRLVEAFCKHLGLCHENFHTAWSTWLTKNRSQPGRDCRPGGGRDPLADEGDPAASQITDKVANDLAAWRCTPPGSYSLGRNLPGGSRWGLMNAGERIIGPLRTRLAEEFPFTQLVIGTEPPAVALGRLALNDLRTHPEEDAN